DLAIKSIAEWIFRFRARNIKKQVAVVTNKPITFCYAHSILPAHLPTVWACIDFGDELPARLFRIGSFLRFSFEAFRFAVAGEKIIDLWPARSGMPGVGVDCFNVRCLR